MDNEKTFSTRTPLHYAAATRSFPRLTRSISRGFTRGKKSWWCQSFPICVQSILSDNILFRENVSNIINTLFIRLFINFTAGKKINIARVF